MQVASFTPMSLLMVVLVMFTACARPSLTPVEPTLPSPQLRGAQLHGHLVELQTRQILPLETFVAAMTAVPLIAVGEEHDHPDIQAFELRLLQALSRHYPQRLALAMEFLERDMQPFVDAYLTGTSNVATLQQQLNASPAFMQYYFPLIQYARQAGIPVLAINLPRRLARQVAREGLQKVLEHLRPEERAYLPDTLTGITAQYRTYFRQEVAQAHPLSDERLERFLEAAHLKDETMAAALSSALLQTAPLTVLAIAGRFHFDYGLAIPTRLKQRLPTVAMRRITTMSVDADETIDLQHLASTELADYIWFATPHPATRPGHASEQARGTGAHRP